MGGELVTFAEGGFCSPYEEPQTVSQPASDAQDRPRAFVKRFPLRRSNTDLQYMLTTVSITYLCTCGTDRTTVSSITPACTKELILDTKTGRGVYLRTP